MRKRAGSVVVVGMGPVGLTAALALSRSGHDVTVLEAGSDLSAESRASTFHPPSLEILDDLGVADALRATGLECPVFQFRDRREGVVAEFDLRLLRDETKYPFRLQSEQSNLTAIIRRRLEETENVTLRFDAPVSGVRLEDEAATVFVDGRESVTASWVLAADGANSAVRRGLALAFDGMTYEERYLVVSTDADLPALIPDLADVSYVSDATEWLVVLRTPRHWRVLFPIPADESDAAATERAAVQRRLRGVADPGEPYRVLHTTLYRVHQRVASAFARGRVLLLGDAAHINSPLGGMGMNGGIHDAWLATRALDLVRDGADPDRCAAAYAQVRRSLALEYVQRETHRNHETLSERDGGARAAWKSEIRAVAADPERAHAHLRQSSMLLAAVESASRFEALVEGQVANGGRKAR